MTWLSVDLPEPFGPMMACTSPLFTVSESPWRISRSSTRTCRFLTSSSDIHSVLNLVRQFEALLDAIEAKLDSGDVGVIVLLNGHDTCKMLRDRGHFDAQRLHPIGHLSEIGPNAAKIFQNKIVWLNHHPTLPSSEIEISFCASTANSIGSCCSTSFTKPLTTRPTASSCDSPRCTQ